LTYNSVCRRTRAKQYSPEVVINESLNFRADSPSTAHAITVEVLETRAAEKWNHGLWYDPEISLETNGMCFVHETV
jgi:hypothetical protein